ncbi:MAG TPA: hypothetical protein VGH98_13530 [Gemmatimonadaceae bacterium]
MDSTSASRSTSLIYVVFASSGLILLACSGGKNQRPADTHSTAAPSIATAQTLPPAQGKTPCAATGQWSDCTVFQALDRAGLAPRRDSVAGAIALAPLTQSGTRLLLGNSEIDVFVYTDAAARERDEARLDRTKFIEATDEPTLRGEPTLIRNVNLLAVLRSRSDHQRERVSDALSAGPPQHGGASSLPQTKVPR